MTEPAATAAATAADEAAAEGISAPAADVSAPLLSAGVRTMVSSCLWFSASGVCLKLAGMSVPFMQICWVRAVIGGSIGLALVLRRGLDPLGINRGLLALRGLLGFVGMALSFFAFTRLPLGEATVLFFINPIFVAPLSSLALGERMGGRGWLCVLLGLAGAVLIAKPAALFGHAQALDGAAVAAALAGAFTASCVFVSLRSLGATEHPLVTVLYLSSVTAVLAAPFCLGSAWHAPTALEWLWLAGVGIFSQAGQVLMAKAYQQERAGLVSTVGYLQVVLATLWGALVFGDVPDALSWAGGGLIIGSTVFQGKFRITKCNS